MRLSVLLVGVAALLVVAGLFLISLPASAADDSESCRNYSDDAIAACSRVIASAKSTRKQVGDAYINRGQNYYKDKEYDRAIADFDQAISLRVKRLSLAYSDRGNAYYAMGDDQKAIDSYDYAVILDSTYSAAYAARGILYEKAGAIERARADYAAALAGSLKSDDNTWLMIRPREHLDALKGK